MGELSSLTARTGNVFHSVSSVNARHFSLANVFPSVATSALQHGVGNMRWAKVCFGTAASDVSAAGGDGAVVWGGHRAHVPGRHLQQKLFIFFFTVGCGSFDVSVVYNGDRSS